MSSRSFGREGATLLPLIAWALLLAPATSWSQTNCMLHTSPQYIRMGGKSVLGPLPCVTCEGMLTSQMSGGSCEDIKDPTPPSPAPTTRGQSTSQADREAEAQRQAEEKRRAEQEEFEHTKRETLGSLKGAPSQTVDIKGGTDVFGLKGNPTDVSLKGAGKPAGSASVPTAWRQLACAVAISNSAAEAVRASRYEDAQYLLDQSRSVLAGGKVEVECPLAPPAPRPPGQASTEAKPPLEVLYDLLNTSTTTQVDRLLELRKRYGDLAKAKEDTHRAVVEKTAVLKEATAQPVATQDAAKAKEHEKLVAEARAALQAARAVESDADKAIQTAIAATTTLDRNRDVYDKARANPARAPELLSQVQKTDPPRPAAKPPR